MTPQETIASFLLTAGLGGLASDALAGGIVTALDAQGLKVYKKKTFRNARRPAQSQQLTPALAIQIKAEWEADKNITQSALAAKHNVNIARVSEAIG
jgi:hypothetical protein